MQERLEEARETMTVLDQNGDHRISGEEFVQVRAGQPCAHTRCRPAGAGGSGGGYGCGVVRDSRRLRPPVHPYLVHLRVRLVRAGRTDAAGAAAP
jgi:hypothetical protein